MCGIFAIFKQEEVACPSMVIENARDQVYYRGPDDSGKVLFCQGDGRWHQVANGEGGWQIGLAHRRLSIIDLSQAGHQPMAYQDCFWVTYNGEVYNYLELRSGLEKMGHRFRSNSDTEVILAAYAEWGTRCFEHFRGMWGLVIVDTIQNRAVLSRDRMGIKPLYLWQSRGLIAIASEVKQFLSLPGFQVHLNHPIGLEYLQTGYEYPAESFFSGVHAVPAATWLSVSLDTLIISSPQTYWHPEEVKPLISDPTEAGRLFANKLEDSVRLHTRSDVPVGCALSGGLDSSSIAVIVDSLANGHNKEIHTFTSSFPGESIDERIYVDTVLRKIHAAPHFVVPNPNTFLDELDDFTWHHDEPVGSFSVYSSYCIARNMREVGIPVTLNGQGGDEILSGYWQTYFLYLRELFRHGNLLAFAEHFVKATSGKGNPDLLRQIPKMLRRYRSRAKSTTWIKLRNEHTDKRSTMLNDILRVNNQERRVFEIQQMFLPRLLKWEDRNSMAFSVEGRYPFLDHELIELCLSFDSSTLYHAGWTKWPLRLGLANRLPASIVNRRSKLGFEAPQDKWLCGPIRPKLESWLNEDRPVWNYVDHDSVRKLAEKTWQLEGRQEEPGQALFRVFMFDKWLDIFHVKS